MINDVKQIKGQMLHIGEGILTNKEDIKVEKISADHYNKFYIASDGLYDQIGGKLKRQFGYKTFKRIILDNHNEKQSVILEKIWSAFENHRGDEMKRDDFGLITFKP